MNDYKASCSSPLIFPDPEATYVHVTPRQPFFLERYSHIIGDAKAMGKSKRLLDDVCTVHQIVRRSDRLKVSLLLAQLITSGDLPGSKSQVTHRDNIRVKVGDTATAIVRTAQRRLLFAMPYQLFTNDAGGTRNVICLARNYGRTLGKSFGNATLALRASVRAIDAESKLIERTIRDYLKGGAV